MSLTVYFTEARLATLRSDQPTDSSDKCTLEYLDEGGANVVFRFVSMDGGDIPDPLQGRLLRLPKHLSHVHGTAQQLQAFHDHFRHIFPVEHLVDYEAVRLDESVPHAVNSTLRGLVRPSRRAQDFVGPHETFGLLVTDMTPKTGDLSVQLKPKWLAQSPSAPAGSKRCRTCALRALRYSQGVVTATDAQNHCPLDLVSEQVDDRKRAAQLATADTRLQAYLTNQAQPLLQLLRRHQQHFDVVGAVGTSDATIFNLCKAMTLRDCTLFLKRSGDHVEARLGDLDLKQPEKLSKWKTIEQSLIDQGWYTNSEAKEVWTAEGICLLSR